MLPDKLLIFTEKLLTWRKRRVMAKKKKQAFKSAVRDWIEAFLWAAAVVLLINQYLFQAYMIPSSSMEKTLLIGDRIFANKIVYGPEALPGIGKLKGFKEPKRGEVIIFENPEYLSKGTLFDLANRIVYMLTLSLVNIDLDPETGKPRHQLLIKRNIGVPGDRIRAIDGNIQFMPEGFDRWVPEEEFKAICGLNYPQIRKIAPDDSYLSAAQTEYRRAAAKNGISDDLPHMIEDLGQGPRRVSEYSFDRYSKAVYESKEAHAINPHERRDALNYYQGTVGWYIPDNWSMPLGDNRDDSRDGRYFGLLNWKKVLGEAEFKYWPINRIGSIK